MTLLDYCISLNSIQFFLVVLGVVDMCHLLLNTPQIPKDTVLHLFLDVQLWHFNKKIGSIVARLTRHFTVLCHLMRRYKVEYPFEFFLPNLRMLPRR